MNRYRSARAANGYVARAHRSIRGASVIARAKRCNIAKRYRASIYEEELVKQSEINKILGNGSSRIFVLLILGIVLGIIVNVYMKKKPH